MQWNKHTHETLGSKAQWFALIEKKLFGLNELKKKGNKKEKLTESLHLTVKIARRLNYNIDLRKLRVDKITGRRNHEAALNEKLSAIILRSQFNLAFQFRRQGHNFDAIRWISCDNPAKIFHNYT